MRARQENRFADADGRSAERSGVFPCPPAPARKPLLLPFECMVQQCAVEIEPDLHQHRGR